MLTCHNHHHMGVSYSQWISVLVSAQTWTVNSGCQRHWIHSHSAVQYWHLLFCRCSLAHILDTANLGTVPDHAPSCIFTFSLTCPLSSATPVLLCICNFILHLISFIYKSWGFCIQPTFYRSTTATAASCFTAVSQHSIQHRSTIPLRSSIMQHRSTSSLSAPTAWFLTGYWAPCTLVNKSILVSLILSPCLLVALYLVPLLSILSMSWPVVTIE
jgi:hypothetical protein